MENETNNGMSPKSVANNILKELRKKYDRDAEFYAIRFMLSRVMGIRSKISLLSLGDQWIKKGEECQLSDTCDKYIREYFFRIERIFEMMKELPRYFEIVEGNIDSYYDEIYVKPAEKFKEYLNTLSVEELKAMSRYFLPNYSDVIYCRLKNESEGKCSSIVISRTRENEYDVDSLNRRLTPSEFHQYDAPMPKSFSSLKEKVEWEAEHDVILNEFFKSSEPEEKIDDDNYLDYLEHSIKND